MVGEYTQTNKRKMVGEGVEKDLYYAASKGDLATFQQLLKGDPYVLDGVSFAGSRNLVHIATIWGQLSIVEEILKIHTQLAKELEPSKSLPIPASQEHVEIASPLLNAAAHMCWSRDCHGMNPIHIAAMNGDVNILQKLIEKDPKPAREKVGRGDTVLHLCVKHNRLKALRFLANNLGDLINEGNDDGDTVLHLAVRYNHVKIITYLVGINKIDKKLRNAKGKTPLQIWSERSHDPATESESSATHSQIREILKYDSATLDEFLQENQHLFSNQSPLHVATMQRREDIVEIMLKILCKENSQPAEELDSQTSTPLPIPAAQEHVGSSKLFTAAPGMCWSRDCHGMNPIHIAAMNGHVDILKKLIEVDSIPAREKVGRGDTVLHLCVKHNQLEALEFLAEKLVDLINEGNENDDGDTVLHLAVRYNHVKIIQYLVQIAAPNPQPLIEQPPRRESPNLDFCKLLGLASLNDVIIVVVILIATMAFQATLSPAGGVWVEGSSLHKAGEAVMASTHPKIYKHYKLANHVAFGSSMFVIILLTTRLPSKCVPFYMLTVYATWMSVASIAVSYAAAVTVTTPNTQTQSLSRFMVIFIPVFAAILGVYSLGNILYEMYTNHKINFRCFERIEP